jgi:hypothetical protein
MAYANFYTFLLEVYDEHPCLLELQQQRSPLVAYSEGGDGYGSYFVWEWKGGDLFSLCEVPEGERSIRRAGHEGALEEAAAVEGLLEGKNDQLTVVHPASNLKILYSQSNNPTTLPPTPLTLKPALPRLHGHYAICVNGV